MTGSMVAAVVVAVVSAVASIAAAVLAFKSAGEARHSAEVIARNALHVSGVDARIERLRSEWSDIHVRSREDG